MMIDPIILQDTARVPHTLEIALAILLATVAVGFVGFLYWVFFKREIVNIVARLS